MQPIGYFSSNSADRPILYRLEANYGSYLELVQDKPALLLYISAMLARGSEFADDLMLNLPEDIWIALQGLSHDGLHAVGQVALNHTWENPPTEDESFDIDLDELFAEIH